MSIHTDRIRRSQMNAFGSISIQRKKSLQKLKNSYTWFDPFAARGHPKEELLTDFEVFVVLTKVVGGFSFLHFPLAYSLAGISSGLVLTIVATIVTIHCNYLWVKCSHEMYYRCRVPKLTYEETVILIFTSQNDWLRQITFLIKLFVQVLVFITYFAMCFVYLEDARFNLKAILKHVGWEETKDATAVPSVFILSGAVILLAFLPNLKRIAQFSIISFILTILLYCSLIEIIIEDDHHFEENINVDLSTNILYFFQLVTGSLLSVCIIQPMENVMQHPNHLIEGFCLAGINSVSLTLVALLNSLFGIIGYEIFGNDSCLTLIRKRLNFQGWRLIVGKLLVISSTMALFPIPVFIMHDVLWRLIYEKFLKWPLLGTIALKIILTVGILLVFIYGGKQWRDYTSIVVNLCATIIGLMIPAILEIATYWQEPSQIPYFTSSATSLHSQSEVKEEFPPWYHAWLVIKNVSIVIFAGSSITAAVYDWMAEKNPQCIQT